MESAEAAFIEGCKFTHTFWRDMEGPTSPYYKKLLVEGYSEHNLPIPIIKTFNRNNKKISPGIYLIYIVSEDGSQSFLTKFLVI